MKTTTSIPGLEDQIEQLVRGHIEATRRAAAEAVERAFSSAPGSTRTRTGSDRSGTTRRASSGRRSPTELSALCERLHEEVCAHPGETMSVLAPALGKTPRELSRPMMALRRAGRVRSVGERDRTRYFPTAAGRVVSTSAD